MRLLAHIVSHRIFLSSHIVLVAIAIVITVETQLQAVLGRKTIGGARIPPPGFSAQFIVKATGHVCLCLGPHRLMPVITALGKETECMMTVIGKALGNEVATPARSQRSQRLISLTLAATLVCQGIVAIIAALVVGERGQAAEAMEA